MVADTTDTADTTDALRAAIEAVPDPELPYVTIGDLGVVRDVHVDGTAATVVLIPTYTGCPATEQIAGEVCEVIRAAGFDPDVRTALSPAWSTDLISARGRDRLAAAGIAPPAPIVTCPRCGSQFVRPVSEFGATACKSLYACQACHEPFERFKEF